MGLYSGCNEPVIYRKNDFLGSKLIFLVRFCFPQISSNFQICLHGDEYGQHIPGLRENFIV
jgi:hypothetical protein